MLAFEKMYRCKPSETIYSKYGLEIDVEYYYFEHSIDGELITSMCREMGEFILNKLWEKIQ